MVDASHRGKVALFPISLSAQNFSTARVLPVLAPLFENYDRVVFFVADRLQIYNKALDATDGVALSDLLHGFNVGERYREERNRWVEKLISEMRAPIASASWSVKGLEDVADADCLRVFRNVMLAYYSVRKFRQDVNGTARLHAVRRSGKRSQMQREYLSRGYLLDEIAVSIRLHVVDGIHDEFYLGDQPLPVMRLYGGEYGFTPSDLAQVPLVADRDRFFRLIGDSGSEWIETTNG